MYLLDGDRPELKDRLLELRDAGQVVIPFAREHVVEAMRGVHAASEPRVAQRATWLLDELSRLTRDLYIYKEVATGRVALTRRTPVEVYEETVARRRVDHVPELDLLLEPARLEVVHSVRTMLDQIASGGTDVVDLYAELERFAADRDASVAVLAENLMTLIFEATQRTTQSLDRLGFTPRELNNESPHTITAAVNARLAAAGSPLDLEELTQWGAEHAPELGNHRIATHAGVLAAVGYHRDRKQISTASRMSDINHAELGLTADVFITDDGNFRERVLAVVHEQHLPVIVTSSAEALEVINALGTPRP